MSATTYRVIPLETADGQAMPGDEQNNQEQDNGIDLLTVLGQLKRNSIGFEDGILKTERSRALDYYKGEHAGHVAQEMPALENRSTVVSTDTADAVETAIPDLAEVLMGDDAIAFKPQNQEDEDAAKQETDYIRNVIYQQNPGWYLLYTALKDALISKVGIFHFQWEGKEETTESETIASEAQVQELVQMGLEVVGAEPTDQRDEQGLPLYKVTLRQIVKSGRADISVVPPEDFGVARNTVRLSDTTYCVMRTRPLVQDLIEQGYDPDVVRSLPSVSEVRGYDERISRDTVNETSERKDPGFDDMREVEILVHYVRLDLEGTGKTQIWRVVTDGQMMVELEREKRSRIEFAAGSPYPMPHRFIGQSLADKVIPYQKWATAMTRAMNDSVYFAMNQRPEIAQSEIIPGVTMEQVADNTPGKPIVTRTGNGVKMLPQGQPSFDILTALEHISTRREESTGVVRNAQGLNPDTLHDTAAGANILIGAAQKRIRLMARLLGETMMRDLYIGLHDLLRSNATMADTIRLRNKWVQIDPKSWQRRKDVIVDIGVGAGGKDQDLAAFREFKTNVIEPIVQVQLARPDAPMVVTPENVYAMADDYAGKLGLKNAERYVTDPAEELQQKQNEPPQPSPEEMKAKQEADALAQKQAQEQQAHESDMAKQEREHAMNQQRAQHEMDIEGFKAQQRATLDREAAAAKLQAMREEAQLKLQLERERSQAEFELAQQKASWERDLAQQQQAIEADIAQQRMNHEMTLANSDAAHRQSMDKQTVELPKNRPGGDLSV
jgi:hypothetical protein